MHFFTAYGNSLSGREGGEGDGEEETKEGRHRRPGQAGAGPLAGGATGEATIILEAKVVPMFQSSSSLEARV